MKKTITLIEKMTLAGMLVSFFFTPQVLPGQSFSVTFNVDMTAAAGFDPAADIVYVTGDFLGWAIPGTQPEDQTLTRVGETMIWTRTQMLPAGAIEYKYFLNAGWNQGEWGGPPNRQVFIDGDLVINDTWAVYGDPPTDPFTVTFTVDMTHAEGFNPTADEVFITGTYNSWAIPGSQPETQLMTRVGESMVWARSLALEAGSYEYKYFVNAGWGGGDSWNGGLNRTVQVSSDQTINDYWGNPEQVLTFANLQWPPTAVVQLGEEITVYAMTKVQYGQVVEGQGYAGLQVWVGYNDEDTHPSTWTQWVEAPFWTYYAPGDLYEYAAQIGAGILQEGTYYYATRFSLNEGEYVFGGFQSGFWDGVSNVSGVLTVYDEIPLSTVTFEVDMSTALSFDPLIDAVYLTGSMLGWSEPGTQPENQLMSRIEGSMIWTKTLQVPMGQYLYKYFINPGWGFGEWLGNPDRLFIANSSQLDINDTWSRYPDLLTLTLIVIDEQLQLVTDASVTFNGVHVPVGFNTTWVVSPGNYSFTIAKEGFVTVNGSINVSTQGTVFYVILEEVEAPDDPELVFGNLQWPPSGVIQLGESHTVYAMALVEGGTVSEGQGYDGLQVWVGYHHEDTHPQNWTNWTQANFWHYHENFDLYEYAAQIGADINQEGTYYYATRFSLNGGSYFYGGFNSGFWDGTTNVSGVLEVLVGASAFEVAFRVDMTGAANFNPGSDEVYMTGTMLGWAVPGTQPQNQLLIREGESMIWSRIMMLETGTHEYKYFLNNGWGGGEWAGEPNRSIVVGSTDLTVNDSWGFTFNVYSVAFQVTDPSSQPIADFVVAWENEPLPDGMQTVYNLAAGTYGYEVSAAGYQPVQGQVTVANDHQVVSLVLQPATSVESIGWKDSSVVFPNPAHDRVTLTIPIETRVQIADLSGKPVAGWVLPRGTHTLNINNLPGGIYVILLTAAQEQRVYKLIKH